MWKNAQEIVVLSGVVALMYAAVAVDCKILVATGNTSRKKLKNLTHLKFLLSPAHQAL
jgi:hypothetical protein